MFFQYLKSKVSSQAMLEDSSSESEEEEEEEEESDTTSSRKTKLQDKHSEVSLPSGLYSWQLLQDLHC
jgi:hypothetical protein